MTEKELATVEAAWAEVASAVQQMVPADDRIICDHVKRAERLLASLMKKETS